MSYTSIIVLEDGSGVANANSYCSATAAQTYFSQRNNQQWSALDLPTQEQLLVAATQDLDSWLRGRWKGRQIYPRTIPVTNASVPSQYIPTKTQALAWPRYGIRDEEGRFINSALGLPVVLINATAEVALIEYSTPFIQQTVSRDNTQKEARIGSLSVQYQDFAPSITLYPQIIQMLQGIANVGGVNMSAAIGLNPDERRSNRRSRDLSKFPDFFDFIPGSGSATPYYPYQYQNPNDPYYPYDDYYDTW